MKNIKIIQKKLQTINKKLFIVGGFCREKFLGNENTGDIDLVTDATPEEMKLVLNIVGEIGQKYGTCIVLEGGDSFELTTFRKDIGSINNRKPAKVEFTDSLDVDSMRRDFTCNSIYYNPDDSSFADPQNGIKDIEKGIIRFVGNIEERIKEDSLRILRFIRFKNKYNFKVEDQKYWDVLKKYIHLLKTLPMERVKGELDKILLNPNNVQALEDLKTIGFLDIFIPELACLDKFSGNKHHLEGDVWVHTKMCVEEMNAIIIRENCDSDKSLMLLWAILLHDIGKGPTFSLGDDGESHYYNHENVGALMFKNDIAVRLKFTNYLQKNIYIIIKEHLRVFSLCEMRKIKSRTLMMQEYFDDLLIVSEADNLGRRPQKVDTFNNILVLYSDFKKILKTKVFFTGDDIIKKYPELRGGEIGKRKTELNNQILVID